MPHIRRQRVPGSTALGSLRSRIAGACAIDARVMGQWNTSDDYGRIEIPNPKQSSTCTVQNVHANCNDYYPSPTDPVRDIKATIIAADKAGPDALQLLPPLRRTQPGPLLQAARARARAEGWWPLGPAPKSAQAGDKRQRAHDNTTPAVKAMMPDDPELVCIGQAFELAPVIASNACVGDAHASAHRDRPQPGWTIVQHHNKNNRKWKMFHGPNSSRAVKSRAVALQIQQDTIFNSRATPLVVKKPHAAVEEVCRRCRGDAEEGNDLLQCDTTGCGASYHMWCLDTPLARVPEGEWLCPDCDPQPAALSSQPHRQPVCTKLGLLLHAATPLMDGGALAPCRRWWDQIAEAGAVTAQRDAFGVAPVTVP